MRSLLTNFFVQVCYRGLLTLRFFIFNVTKGLLFPIYLCLFTVAYFIAVKNSFKVVYSDKIIMKCGWV